MEMRMKYQLIVSERTTRQPKRVKLKPELEIGEAGYWQHRIQDIIDNLELNEHVTVQVVQ